MTTTTQPSEVYRRLVDAGALNPLYAARIINLVARQRSFNCPMSRDDAAEVKQVLCREDPAVASVWDSLFLSHLKQERRNVRQFNALLDEMDEFLFSEEKDRIYHAFVSEDKDWPQITKLYDGPTTSFYQQQVLFDYLDQQAELGAGFRRPEYQTKIDPNDPHNGWDPELLNLALHSGAFWDKHDFKSPIEYVDANYHLPAMQSLVGTRTWSETHPQGPSLIVRLYRYGSEEQAQKVVDTIKEGARGSTSI